ncbi:MAG: NAD-dependent epimerase/dehydratase family protein [Chitinispirillaceae bacterium]|nr:NAD-dependent epimerase/dehydratase family protein [Chitinispirillaceae bacterium]
MGNSKRKTLGIIGCGGFIGSHLVEGFKKRGDVRIMGIDRSCDKIAHLLPDPDISVSTADIRSLDTLEPWIGECDAVVLLAALCNPSLYNTVPLTVIESNFMLPARIVELCAKTKTWLIHFSTSEVYGKTVSGLCGSDRAEHYLLREEESPLILGNVHAQRWSYACAKQLLERLIVGYGLEQGLRYTIVRPFNFIGPRMDYLPGIDGEGIPRVLACFMKALLSREPLQLVDGGFRRRCFTYISDAVDAVIRIVDRPSESACRIFNIGNPDNEISIRGLAELMREIYSSLTNTASEGSPLVPVTGELFYGKGYEDSDRRLPDIALARELLEWEPKVGIFDAVRSSIVSYLHHYKKVAA